MRQFSSNYIFGFNTIAEKIFDCLVGMFFVGNCACLEFSVEIMTWNKLTYLLLSSTGYESRSFEEKKSHCCIYLIHNAGMNLNKQTVDKLPVKILFCMPPD